jgi:hypothetical protein
MELYKEESEMMDIVQKDENGGHDSYSAACHHFLYPIIVGALLLTHQDSLD